MPAYWLAAHGPIENVHVTAHISASTEYIGGLAGQGCKITNSSFIGTLSGAAYTGGLVGEERQDTISNCHVSAVITTAFPTASATAWAVSQAVCRPLPPNTV